MSEYRDRAFTLSELKELFRAAHGYYNLSNQELADFLISMNLLDSSKRKDYSVATNFIKWSFSVSFLQLISAWQWFFSGVILARSSSLPAQELQMYHYAKFFSWGGFLSGQMKGCYTLDRTFKEDERVILTRQEIWLDCLEGNPCLSTGSNGGSDHLAREKWFYSVFQKWDLKARYPELTKTKQEPQKAALCFHSGSRNWFTYFIGAMAEELYEEPCKRGLETLSNETLISLWEKDSDLGECYPEIVWTFEHMRVLVDLHTEMLDSFEDGSPYKTQQVILIEGMCEHHAKSKTGFVEVLKKAMPSIIEKACEVG